MPKLSKNIFENLFDSSLEETEWPEIDESLLIDNKLELPIQINGKLATTIEANRGYSEQDILKSVYQLDKIKSKIEGKEIKKVINVQDKIINIIAS